MRSKSINESRKLLALASARLASSSCDGGASDGDKSINNVREEDEDEEEQDNQTRNNRYILVTPPPCCIQYKREILVSFMILTLVIVLLAVVEPLRLRAAQNQQQDNDTTNNSSGVMPNTSSKAPWHYDPPTSSSSSSSTTTAIKVLDTEKFNRIKDRLLEHGISHANTLELSYTPQYKALTWLVRDDTRQLDIPNGGSNNFIIDDLGLISPTAIDDEAALFQRYALAVFYYQTTDINIVQMTTTGHDIEDPFDVPYNPMELTSNDIQWTNNEYWLSNTGLCLWYGITCHPRVEEDDSQESNNNDSSNDRDYYVSALNLTANNIYGIIPREVYTAFTKLTLLDISYNAIEGTLSAHDISKLSNLQDLFLHNNNLSGQLPSTIDSLSKLYNLYINDNKFHGR
jgi:hypothetical protein